MPKAGLRLSFMKSVAGGSGNGLFGRTMFCGCFFNKDCFFSKRKDQNFAILHSCADCGVII